MENHNLILQFPELKEKINDFKLNNEKIKKNM